MADNWIKVSRKLLDHWVWADKPFSMGQAWVDLLLLANYKDKKVYIDGNLVLAKRGSLITSQVKLAERWKWDRKAVKSFLNLLENDGMISYEATTKWTSITIVNYTDFQDVGTTDCSADGSSSGQALDKCGTSDGQVLDKCWTSDGQVLDRFGTQHKKEKKGKEGKERKERKEVYSDIAELNAALLSFIEYRKRIKKPMTDRAIELLIRKLENLSDNVEEQIEILNQSELNGWAGVFPLKDKPKATTGDRLSWIDAI